MRLSVVKPGSGGSFKNRNLQEKCIIVIHGWQAIYGPKVIRIVFFGAVAVVTRCTTAGCSAVYCVVVV